MAKTEPVQQQRVIVQIDKRLSPQFKAFVSAASDDEARPILTTIALVPLNSTGDYTDWDSAEFVEPMACDSYRLNLMRVPKNKAVDVNGRKIVQFGNHNAGLIWVDLDAAKRLSGIIGSSRNASPALQLPGLQARKVITGHGDKHPVIFEYLPKRNGDEGENTPPEMWRVTHGTSQRDVLALTGNTSAVRQLIPDYETDTAWQWLDLPAREIGRTIELLNFVDRKHQGARIEIDLRPLRGEGSEHEVPWKLTTGGGVFEVTGVWRDVVRQVRRTTWPDAVLYNPRRFTDAIQAATAHLYGGGPSHPNTKVRLWMRDEKKIGLFMIAPPASSWSYPITTLVMPLRP